MDAETLQAFDHAAYPLRITVNTGQTYDVPSRDAMIVGDYAAAVLARRNDKLIPITLGVMNITSVESVAESP